MQLKRRSTSTRLHGAISQYAAETSVYYETTRRYVPKAVTPSVCHVSTRSHIFSIPKITCLISMECDVGNLHEQMSDELINDPRLSAS
jgi:hypothetical protein